MLQLSKSKPKFANRNITNMH